MTSLNKKRKAKNRMKNNGASDRYYLGAKIKDAHYAMYNSSLRAKSKKYFDGDQYTTLTRLKNYKNPLDI